MEDNRDTQLQIHVPIVSYDYGVELQTMSALSNIMNTLGNELTLKEKDRLSSWFHDKYKTNKDDIYLAEKIK